MAGESFASHLYSFGEGTIDKQKVGRGEETTGQRLEAYREVEQKDPGFRPQGGKVIQRKGKRPE